MPLVPCTGIFLGPSKSGKTVALISMILEQYRGVFGKICVFSPSVNIDDGWIPVKKYIEQDLGVNTEQEQAYWDEWDEAALRGIIQRQRKITTAASALLLKHEFLDGGADDVTLATLGEVLLEPTLATLGNFLVRSNSQSSVASASFTVGGFQLEGYAMTLSAFAWNIVRTYTLTPGRRYSFGCRYRLGTASNLVMYVSAADNDYVGVTGTFLGTPSQGVWSTARLDFSVPPGGASEPSEARSPGWCSSRRARWTCTACRSGPRP